LEITTTKSVILIAKIVKSWRDCILSYCSVLLCCREVNTSWMLRYYWRCGQSWSETFSLPP